MKANPHSIKSWSSSTAIMPSLLEKSSADSIIKILDRRQPRRTTSFVELLHECILYKDHTSDLHKSECEINEKS